MVKEVWFTKANLRLLAVSFFLLEQKEPKIQECRIASGRHSGQRAWVVTLKMPILQTILYELIYIADIYLTSMLLLPLIFCFFKNYTGAQDK